MSASRAEPCRSPRAAAGTALLAVGIALSGVPQAVAQDVTGGPVLLVPNDLLRPTPAPPPVAEPTQAGLIGTLPKQRIEGIEVNPLAQIVPDAIGVLGPEGGGFGAEMWRGTKRTVIGRLLRRLPADMPSPTMRDLARRLLLSVAPPPLDAVGDWQGVQTVTARGAESGSHLLALRAERLAALGEIPALISLLAVVPARVEDQALDRLRIDSQFLAHRQDEACRLVRSGVAVHHDLPDWQKAMAFCHLVAGETDRGMLGLDLLREQEVGDDPAFFQLAGRMQGMPASASEPVALSPLHVAMLRATGVPFAANILDTAEPGLVFAVATAPNALPEQRAIAAERACAQGQLDGAALAQSYEAMSFAPEQLGNAIQAAEAFGGVRARALLYQAARRESLAAARAEVLRVALERGEAEGLYQAAVAVLVPLIREIEPTPQLVWFAATAGRALYAAGQTGAAGAWLTLGRQESLINPEASAAVAALWPYSRLAGGGALTTDGTLTAWRAMREAAGVPPSSRAQEVLRVAFQALGERDPMAWNEIAADAEPHEGRMPDAALLYALVDASEARRLGETVLLAVLVLGEAGPAQSHGLALGAVLSALVRVGLEREARALAIEAALASGV